MIPRGTQPERTTLAVHRTAAGTLVVAVTLLRVAAVRQSVTGAVAAALATVSALMSLLFARFAYRGERGMVPFPRAAAAAALAVALLAIAGLVIGART